MAKKLLSVIFACLLSISIASSVLATQQPSKEEVLEALIIKLQLDLQTTDPAGDLGPVTANIQKLLENLQIVLRSNDPELLKAVVTDYIAKTTELKAEQLDPTCGPALLLGLFSGAIALGNTVAADGDPTCLSLSVSHLIAEMISTVQAYRICVIDNSPNPDPATRQQIVRRQTLVETFDFIAFALDIFSCTPTPTLADYINLLGEFLEIFPKPPPTTTTTTITASTTTTSVP